jgi:polysaccharide transporter, PST family
MPPLPAAPAEEVRWDVYFSTDAVRADLRARSVRSGLVQLTTQVVRLALLVGSGMLMARLLTPFDFGLLAIVGLLIAFVESFRDFGLPMAAVQRESLTHQLLSSLFWTSLLLTTLMTLGIMLLAPVLAWVFGEPRLTDITIAMATGLFTLSLGNQHESLLVRQMEFTRLRTIEVASLATGVALGIVAAWSGAGYWALVAQFMITALTRTAGLWLSCAWRPSAPRRTSNDEVRALISYGADVTGFRIVTHLSRNLDRVLIGYFSGVTAVGLYDSAYRWSLYPFQQLFTPLMSVAVASLSRVRNDAGAYRTFCRRGFLPLFSVVIPALAFMAAEPGPVIRLLLGEQWLEAIPLFQLLCVAAIGTSMIKVTTWIYLAEGTTRRQLLWALISFPVLVVPVVVGARWGAYGIAFGFMVGTWALTYPSLAFCLSASPLRLHDFIAIAGRPLLASAGAAVLVRAAASLLDSMSLPAEVAVKAALFAVAYAALWLALPGGRRAAGDILKLRDDLVKRSPGDGGAAPLQAWQASP